MSIRVAFVVSFERVEIEGVPSEEIKVSPGDDNDGSDPTSHAHWQPSGIDAQPLPGDAVALVDESGSGEESIAGYADIKNAGVAGPGELRAYSRSSNGTVKAHLHIKSDGTIELSNDNGSVTLAPSGKVTITGDLQVDGNISTSGDVTAVGDVAALVVPGAPVDASVHLSTHTHPAPGGATSPPTPGT